jgi:Arc/MetJ family transcription regulator
LRTTVAIDDDLLEKAVRLTGLNERRALIREALRALIQRESARRLAPGSAEATVPPRRRPDFRDADAE